jgi:hypothetical protein
VRGQAGELETLDGTGSMREPNDWRLRNQLSYFKRAELSWRDYRAFRPGWEHDHCEFCSAKFSEGNDSEALHAGFTTCDEYRWVCPQCFADFKDLFEWRVIVEAP